MSPLYFVGFGLWLAIDLLFCKTYRISRLRAGLYTLSFVYAVAGAVAGGLFYRYICTVTKSTPSASIVAIFGGVVFTPVLIILTVLLEKAIRRAVNRGRTKKERPLLRDVSVRDTLDLLTPGCLVVLALSKLSCHFDQCCYGVPWRWGVYSPYLETTVFPVQIGEFLSIVLILLICIFLKRSAFYRRGMAYPLAAAFYTVFRFGWEFLRYYPDTMRHAFFGMTIWQVCCVAVFIASAVSMAVLYRTQPSEPLPGLFHKPEEKTKRKPAKRK